MSETCRVRAGYKRAAPRPGPATRQPARTPHPASFNRPLQQPDPHPMTVIALVVAGNLMLAGLFSLVAVALD
ncbi:hypothetical protein [Methylobacterium sp. A54F]